MTSGCLLCTRLWGSELSASVLPFFFVSKALPWFQQCLVSWVENGSPAVHTSVGLTETSHTRLRTFAAGGSTWGGLLRTLVGSCIPCSGCPGSRARAVPLWLCLGLACASWAWVARHVLRVRCQSGPLDCRVLGSQRGEAVRVVLCVSPAPSDCPVRSGGRQVLGAKVSDACF